MHDGPDDSNKEQSPSLAEANRSLTVQTAGPWIRRFLGFAGPGFMVSVGYMDPGNWATDLAGGSKYGYTLIWVIFVANLMAIFLQTLCARLGLAGKVDLAQACQRRYKKPAAIALWILCEIAIIACDLAEVIGSAVALNLLFGIPLVFGVLITGIDVLLILGLMKFGFRKLEAVVLTLVLTIAGCFAIEMFLAKPDWLAIGGALVTPRIPDREALLISVGILGATVMPHNLYLHSSIVQTRKTEQQGTGLREAIRMNTIDTALALGLAFFVNAAILVLAAAVFHPRGIVVEELGDAHKLLEPLIHGGASVAFAVALLASGQSSTITGTLAGQIVMEGFLNIRVNPQVRRIVSRLIAIIPAVIIVVATGGKGTIDLLVLSQVVLSMQLSFAIFPLMSFTSSRQVMGEHANPMWVRVLGYLVCSIIAALNGYLLFVTFRDNVVYGTELLAALCGIGLAFAAWVKYGYRGSTVGSS